jgi:hypothetical protein
MPSTLTLKPLLAFLYGAGGPSIACSTAAAIAWDEAWKHQADPSGRAISDVHDNAYGTNPTAAANGKIEAVTVNGGMGSAKSGGNGVVGVEGKDGDVQGGGKDQSGKGINVEKVSGGTAVVV